MTEGWNTYVKGMQTMNNQITTGCIFGHDGLLWGHFGIDHKNLENRDKLTQDVKYMSSLMQDDQDLNNHAVHQNGFFFMGKKWACVRLENNLLAGKGKTHDGIQNTQQFCAKKTGRTVVIAIANAEGANTNAVNGASIMAERLEDSQF